MSGNHYLKIGRSLKMSRCTWSCLATASLITFSKKGGLTEDNNLMVSWGGSRPQYILVRMSFCPSKRGVNVHPLGKCFLINFHESCGFLTRVLICSWDKMLSKSALGVLITSYTDIFPWRLTVSVVNDFCQSRRTWVWI